jgi:hypothetical protein
MGRLYETESAAILAGSRDLSCRLMAGFRIIVRGSLYGIVPDGCGLLPGECPVAHYVDCGIAGWLETYD